MEEDETQEIPLPPAPKLSREEERRHNRQVFWTFAIPLGLVAFALFCFYIALIVRVMVQIIP
jgi:hypothetical protein